MTRALSLLFAVAALSVAALAGSASPSLAAAPSATLTKVEYKDLTKWLADETLFGKKGSFKDGLAGCKALAAPTALLKALQSSCEADLLVYSDVAESGFLQADCAKIATTTSTTTTPTMTSTTTATGTTTTGTTTTPTPSVTGLTGVQLATFACMKPVYEIVSRHVSDMFGLDTAAHQAGVARGLRGECLNTLVATTEQLGDEKAMNTAEKRVVADATVLAKVADGYSSGSGVNGKTILADVRAFNRAFTKLGKDGTPNRLSTCAHQS